MKKLILYIDTAKRDFLTVAIISGDKKTPLYKITQKAKAQNVLLLIEKILKENNLKLSDLSQIRVNSQPGSFIGLRVGVSVANALAFLLNIPVNGKKIETDLKYQ